SRPSHCADVVTATWRRNHHWSAESCATVNPVEIRRGSQLIGLTLIMRHSAPSFAMLPPKVVRQAPLVSPPLFAMPHGYKSWFHKQGGTACLLGDDVAPCRSCFLATAQRPK